MLRKKKPDRTKITASAKKLGIVTTLLFESKSAERKPVHAYFDFVLISLTQSDCTPHTTFSHQKVTLAARYILMHYVLKGNAIRVT